MTVTDYLDETHAASMLAVERIRRYTQQLRRDAAGHEVMQRALVTFIGQDYLMYGMEICGICTTVCLLS